MAGLLSTTTVAVVGLSSKLFLNIGYCASVNVDGLHHLINALESDARSQGQGVITVSNHISTLDDPLAWGILPTRYFFQPRKTRWALGASEVIFTNPLFRAFFRQGQTLETFRGEGVYQPAIDSAIRKLDDGEWVHMFSEGKVNQPKTYNCDSKPVTNPTLRLPRFKWGIGRILMEVTNPPTIIPMWLTGFDQLMPEGREFPFKYLPKPGVHLGVTFGTPFSAETLRHSLRQHRESASGIQHARARTDEARIRQDVTATIHDAVEALGVSIMRGNREAIQ